MIDKQFTCVHYAKIYNISSNSYLGDNRSLVLRRQSPSPPPPPLQPPQKRNSNNKRYDCKYTDKR